MVVVLCVIFLLALGVLGLWLYRRNKTKALPVPVSAPAVDPEAYQVSYAPPQFEWSGNSAGTLPVKVLTYKQYECLEDARYGFRIVGLPPSELKQPQPHKTRGHGLKTVASLSNHGFLTADGSGGYNITDLGLNALEVCTVRY